MSPRIPLGVVAHFEKHCEFRLNFTIQLYPEKSKNDQTHCNNTLIYVYKHEYNYGSSILFISRHVIAVVREVLVNFLDAPGFVIQLSFSIRHLALLKQQLLLQLCQSVLGFLHFHQQVPLTLSINKHQAEGS